VYRFWGGAVRQFHTTSGRFGADTGPRFRANAVTISCAKTKLRRSSLFKRLYLFDLCSCICQNLEHQMFISLWQADKCWSCSAVVSQDNRRESFADSQRLGRLAFRVPLKESKRRELLRCSLLARVSGRQIGVSAGEDVLEPFPALHFAQFDLLSDVCGKVRSELRSNVQGPAEGRS
jgi:hypothetical protein